MKHYWIKERCNPQLGIYYVACGQMSKTEARMHERAIYGTNTMHGFATKSDYLAELARLRENGERVQT